MYEFLEVFCSVGCMVSVDISLDISKVMYRDYDFKHTFKRLGSNSVPSIHLLNCRMVYIIRHPSTPENVALVLLATEGCSIPTIGSTRWPVQRSCFPTFWKFLGSHNYLLTVSLSIRHVTAPLKKLP